MDKSFATDDHTALLEAAGGKAFTFFERSSKPGAFTKSASEVITKKDLQDHMPPDDMFGVHLITMGAEEAFGPNRNGDSASQKSLDTHHGTFEKFGCVFREHANRNPITQGVGDVRLARVNPKMHRGELIAWVSKDKAPDMYKAASAGEELSWSMSMRLPHDECSCCLNKSKHRGTYCDHLRHSMLNFVPGFEKYAYARNEDDVKFFDISEVKRRADRIATYLGYTFNEGEMAKAASELESRVITGSEWAEHQLGHDRVVPFEPWEELTLEKLAEAEEFVRSAAPSVIDVLHSVGPADLTQEQIEILAQPDFRSAGGELAKKAMIINFPTFASLVTGRSIEELRKDAGCCDAMDVKLPTLMSDLFRDGGSRCGEEVAESVEPDSCGCSFSPKKDSIDRLMSSVGEDAGMDDENTRDRAIKMTIIKSASAVEAYVPHLAANKVVDPFYGGLIDAYGRYLVKAAHSIKDLPNVSTHTLFRGLAASLAIRLR